MNTNQKTSLRQKKKRVLISNLTGKKLRCSHFCPHNKKKADNNLKSTTFKILQRIEDTTVLKTGETN